jgi:hypothetical protein
MSSSSVPSPTAAAAVPSILSISISEKLTKSNYPLWRVQVLLAVHATQLEGLLTGDEQAPEEFIIVNNDNKTTTKQRNLAYVSWVARDQVVLSYLLSSLTRETLQHVSRSVTSAQAWKTLADLYSSQTRARSVNTRIALTTTKKNHMTVSDYYAKMCQFADDLATSGTTLHDDELVTYLLAGLDEDYNPIFTIVVARADPMSPSELYAQLLSFEHHTHLQSQPSDASAAMELVAAVDTALVASPVALVADVVVVVAILVAAGPLATTPRRTLPAKSVPRLAMVPKLVGTATLRIPLSSILLLLLRSLQSL